MNKVITLIGRKGVIATLFHGIYVAGYSLRSRIKCTLLSLLRYTIGGTVHFGGKNSFFQSHSRHVSMGHNIRFGRCTRLDAGFGGKISIGDDVLIDDNCFITAQNSITIGSHVQISAYSFITDFNHNFESRSKPIVEQGCSTKPVIIGDDVWIGAHTCILAGVTVGKGAIVGAGAVVTKNVRPYTIVAGNPAREIRKRP